MTGLAIGLVYELLGSVRRRPGDPPDFDAEYEPEATLEALEGALRRLGHEPVRLGTPHELLAAAAAGEVALDASLSIAEGYGTRNREAWAPVLLEMLGIPRMGSDALALSLSLDKAWTREVVAAAGVPVARGFVVADLDALGDPGALPFAASYFVKPRWEGTAKGITRASRVDAPGDLRAAVARVLERYRQPALVEAFLPGAEYTVCVVDHAPARPLPVLQRALDAETGIGHHALGPAERGAAEITGALSPGLEKTLQQLALRAFDALQCCDFARVDFKLDAAGEPRFLEINPLPTFAPDGTFAIVAELEGRPFEALLADVFGAALRRLGLGAA